MNQFAYNAKDEQQVPQVSTIVNSANREQIRNKNVDPVKIHQNHQAQIQPTQIILPLRQPIQVTYQQQICQQQPNVAKPKQPIVIKEVPAQKEKIRIVSQRVDVEQVELTQSIDQLNDSLEQSDQVVLFLIQDSLKVILNQGIFKNTNHDRQISQALQLVQDKVKLRDKLLQSVQMGTRKVSTDKQQAMNTYINRVFSQQLK